MNIIYFLFTLWYSCSDSKPIFLRLLAEKLLFYSRTLVQIPQYSVNLYRNRVLCTNVFVERNV